MHWLADHASARSPDFLRRLAPRRDSSTDHHCSGAVPAHNHAFGRQRCKRRCQAGPGPSCARTSSSLTSTASGMPALRSLTSRCTAGTCRTSTTTRLRWSSSGANGRPQSLISRLCRWATSRASTSQSTRRCSSRR
eukprot:UN3299